LYYLDFFNCKKIPEWHHNIFPLWPGPNKIPLDVAYDHNIRLASRYNKEADGSMYYKPLFTKHRYALNYYYKNYYRGRDLRPYDYRVGFVKRKRN
jgi:hypothetical protein